MIEVRQAAKKRPARNRSAIKIHAENAPVRRVGFYIDIRNKL